VSHALAKIAGIARPDGEAPKPTDWVCALAPLVAPLAIMVAGSRISALLPVAFVWIAVMIPGLLAVHAWFPRSHPLGQLPVKLGVASVLALLPFAVFSYLGCLLHWRLTTVLTLYAVAYLASVVLLVSRLLRKAESAIDEPGDVCGLGDVPLTVPRWNAMVVLVCVALVMVGVVMSSPTTPTSDTDFVVDNLYNRPNWWYGAALGAVASIVGAAVLAFGLLRGKGSDDNASDTSDADKPKGRSVRSGKSKSSKTSAVSTFDWTPWLTGLLWIASAVVTVQLMRATYSESYPKMEQIGKGALVWNVDDVAYVSEAVDYRYGHPLALHDPSVGGEYHLPRSRTSPLFAPLVAMISRFTGISCAALHHSVMPPLVVLIGASCFAAVMSVVFRGDRWAVPLGLLIALLLVLKTWDYARVVVEMLIYRAMQPKALHLWWLHPLQIATAVLLVRNVSWRHFALAVVVAFIGYLTHPLAAVMGLVLCTSFAVVALVENRRAVVPVLALLVAYCALAGDYYLASHAEKQFPALSSGRKAGDPLQSRDLVRGDKRVFSLGGEFASDLDSGSVTASLAEAFRKNKIGMNADIPIDWDDDDSVYLIGSNARGGYRVQKVGADYDVYQIAADPQPRHDPIWTFGLNTLYLAGALAVPFVIALGLRRRELLYVGLFGAAVLLSTNFTPLGQLLKTALPLSIFWRARWFLPSFVNLASVAVVIDWAVRVLIRSRDGDASGPRALGGAVVAVAAFGIMLACTGSRMVRAGEEPAMLSKFSPEIHELVGKLGGVEASPYVWGTFQVHHELPQLMPNINLVFSRDKFMRPADDPIYRRLALSVFNTYRQKSNQVNPRAYDRLFEIYPIDHVVVDMGYRSAAKRLQTYLESRGWRRIGQTSGGRYEVWKNDARAAANEKTKTPSHQDAKKGGE
jgi:hypothetical protein